MKNELKVRYASDIHVEQFKSRDLAVSDIIVPHELDKKSVLILAGDNFHLPIIISEMWTHNINRALSELSKRFALVLYVMGNHEYYSINTMHEIDGKFDRMTEKYDNIHRLKDGDVIKHEGYVFMGNTLWTDVDTTFETDNINEKYIDASKRMSDFHLIHFMDDEPLEPEHTKKMFYKNIKHIEDNLKQYKDSVKVVVTHHAPSEKSSLPKFNGSDLNVFFYSDLSDLIKDHRPDVWIHGHMHNTSQYTIGETVILANPGAYGKENSSFDAQAHFYLTDEGFKNGLD